MELNEQRRDLWEIVQDNDTTTKEKTMLHHA